LGSTGSDIFIVVLSDKPATAATPRVIASTARTAGNKDSVRKSGATTSDVGCSTTVAGDSIA
jgi:hypothetical protein